MVWCEGLCVVDNNSQSLQLRQVKGISLGNYRNAVETKSTEKDERMRGHRSISERFLK